MYNTSADDLARIAGDLSTLATTYTNSAQQLDQEATSLDGTASQLVNGGPERWVGQSSEAFLGAWGERKARMQQASQILTQSAQYLKQMAQTIDEHLPTIRADQSLMANSAYNSLAGPDQQSVLNEDSQAQNAIITALSTLNSQLESLAEEIGDCPQEHQDSNTPGSGDVPYNKSDSGSGSPTGGPGGYVNENPDATPDEQEVGQFLNDNLPGTTVKGLAEVPNNPSPDYQLTEPDGSVHKADLYQPATTNTTNMYSYIMGKGAKQGDDTVIVELGQGVDGTGQSYKVSLDDAQSLADSVFNDGTKVNRIIFLKRDPITGQLSLFLDARRP